MAPSGSFRNTRRFVAASSVDFGDPAAHSMTTPMVKALIVLTSNDLGVKKTA